MLKKTIIGLALVMLLVIALVSRFFFSNTSFHEKSRSLYIYSGKASEKAVMQAIEENHLVRNPTSFNFIASRMDVWPKLRAGKY